MAQYGDGLTCNPSAVSVWISILVQCLCQSGCRLGASSADISEGNWGGCCWLPSDQI